MSEDFVRKQRTPEEQAEYERKLAEAKAQVEQMKRDKNTDSAKQIVQNPDFAAPLGDTSCVKHVIAVLSGKGGVGKSLVTSLLAVAMSKAGYHCGILDADLTGPSIPTAFGISGQLWGSEQGIIPAKSAGGIDIISMNLMLEDAGEPVIWRGPVIAQVVKQFWSDTHWRDIDYLFVDMPPGTGDVPLTVFQSLPVDGVVVVTTPQDMVSMIVGKAVRMARMMNKPVLGLVENMSYFVCDHCHNEHELFGNSQIAQLAAEYGIEKYVRMPLVSGTSKLIDAGKVENINCDPLQPIVDTIIEKTRT